jgi:hypothetical protein
VRWLNFLRFLVVLVQAETWVVVGY